MSDDFVPELSPSDCFLSLKRFFLSLQVTSVAAPWAFFVQTPGKDSPKRRSLRIPQKEGPQKTPCKDSPKKKSLYDS